MWLLVECQIKLVNRIHSFSLGEGGGLGAGEGWGTPKLYRTPENRIESNIGGCEKIVKPKLFFFLYGFSFQYLVSSKDFSLPLLGSQMHCQANSKFVNL